MSDYTIKRLGDMKCPHCRTDVSLAKGTLRHHCEGGDCLWLKCAVCKAVIENLHPNRHYHKLDSGPLCTGKME